MGIRGTQIIKAFGTPPVNVLKGIDFEIKEGEFVAITGRSGSGKSTLLYVMSSLDPATNGVLEIDGKNVLQMDSPELHRFRNERMGFVFQFHYLLPELTALENVLMPARKTKQEEALSERAKDLLRSFDLESKFHRLPRELSGGEMQRVAIARALVMHPKYVFADEPTGNLDSINGDKVLAILKEVTRSHGTAVIIVTHDPDYAAMTDRKIQLVDGRTV